MTTIETYDFNKDPNLKSTISNTEISTFDTCEYAHGMSYDRNLQAKYPPDYIYRGEVGHSALQAYYFEMKEGASQDKCLQAAHEVIAAEIKNVAHSDDFQPEKIPLLIELRDYITEYSLFYGKEPFKVLAIEEEFRAPLLPHKDYMMRLDLLVEMTSGPYRGDVIVYDHKFTYNFKTTTELEMDGQLPKLVKTLKENGYVISKAWFNQIRYRKDAVERFKRSPCRITPQSLLKIWEHQKDTAMRIEEAEASNKPRHRVLNSYICKRCDFAEPCKAELNGDNITNMLKANYVQRDRPFKTLLEV